jgi:hypothetical protein
MVQNVFDKTIRRFLVMALHYYCRHCGIKIGTIDAVSLRSEQLGFHRLTEKERLEMIDYLPNGDIYVKTICEDCQEALDRNPDFHQCEKFIQ